MRPLKVDMPARWVLPIATVLLLLLVFILQFQVLQYTRGAFVYPQDDAYVRMAIAKNLAINGSWSISSNAFSPSSSSILYPLLLAGAFKTFGIYPIIPFEINLFCALILVAVVQRWLEKRGVAPFSQILILTAVIFLTPLPIIINIGMEHTLQALLSFLFLTGFCDAICGERNRLSLQIYLYAFLVTATRYEGLFLLIVACLFLLFQRRWASCILLGLVGMLPVILFGIYSLQKGGYFLPNSILFKALPVPLNWANIKSFLSEDTIAKLLYPFPSKGGIGAERLLLIMPLTYWLYIDVMRQEKLYRYLVIFCMAMVGLHLTFATAILFYRYEAYLVACCIPVLGLVVAKNPAALIPKKGAATRWVAAWTGLILLYPLASRSWNAYTDTGKSCAHMYDQGYQAASFLKQYYDHSTVVLFQPGAAAYFIDGKALDLTSGIWNMEVARSKQEEYYRAEFQNFLVEREKPSIAVIPQRDYNPYLLGKWERIASWGTENNVTQGTPYVMFYAIDKNAGQTLKTNLLAYQQYLPPGVKVTYYDEIPKY